MYITIVRTVLLYLLIIFGVRIMGKRQIGELQPSELVVTILISNIATLPIEDSNVPLLGGIIPILTIVCFEVFFATMAMHSKTARKIFSGSPKIVIRDGVIDQKVLCDLRFSTDDLMEQLRINNVFDIQDVLFAIVETTGSLTIYPKYAARPVTHESLGMTKEDYPDAPPVVMINNGEIVPDAFGYCNLSQGWLERILKKEGYSVKEIFLLTCDRCANYVLIPKNRRYPL